LAKITSDIMYNEPKHIVSVFKDYLILDDFSEYLKRFYRLDEAIERLPRIFEFYNKFSKVFPNYVAIPMEGRKLFKNIERKQKIIDERNNRMIEWEQNGSLKDSVATANKMFDSGFHKDLTEMPDVISCEEIPSVNFDKV